MKIINIAAGDSGQRLDKFLLKYFKAATNGFIHRMLRKKNITLNKSKAEGSEILHENDEIRVFFSDDTFQKMRGLALQSDDYEELKDLAAKYCPVILYEDDDFIACNKPAGIRSQKNSPEDVSINEYMLSYLIRTGKLDFDCYSRFKPSVVNRLDTNTTGIILFAKTLKGAKKLTEDIRNREIEKYYLAVVSGEIDQSLVLDGYLSKDPACNTVTVLKQVEDDRKEKFDRILTEICPICNDGDNSLILVKLVTGKTHQIRAHLQSVGHPIIGDLKYGDDQINKEYRKIGIKSQLLHAYQVVIDGKTITCPPPESFRKVINYGDLELKRPQRFGL